MKELRGSGWEGVFMPCFFFFFHVFACLFLYYCCSFELVRCRVSPRRGWWPQFFLISSDDVGRGLGVRCVRLSVLDRVGTVSLLPHCTDVLTHHSAVECGAC